MTSLLPLEHVLLPWTQLDWPLAWDRRFGRAAPLGVELGFGNGEHLCVLARDRPDWNWVGVEVSWGSVHRLASRIRRDALPNVRIVQGDAGLILSRLFPSGSLSEVVINHPDPWPKKRHASRRLVSPNMAALLARRLAPAGRLTVVTDHAAYADEIEAVLRGEPAFASVMGAPRVHEIPGRVPTKYERKALAQGGTIHYFLWRRLDGGAPPETIADEVGEMPNVFLKGSLAGGALLPDFTPRSHTEDHAGEAVRAHLLSVYAAPASRWLVETRVEDGGFLQHLMLSVEAKGDGLLLTVAPVGFPRPTRGVKRALAFLADLILTAHPGLSLERSTVGERTVS